MNFFRKISFFPRRSLRRKLCGSVIIPATCCLLLFHCNNSHRLPRILIFTKADFYIHESTPTAVDTLIRLCRENQLSFDVTDDDTYFTDEKLKNYAAVVFLNTAGNILNPSQESAFERYIRSGGGFMGIHSVVDTEHQWEWYGGLVGARFERATDLSDIGLQVNDKHHPSTQSLDSILYLNDEGFILKDLSPFITPLLTRISETMTNDMAHPVSWFRQYGRSRIFITTLGHSADLYANSDFIEHLSGALTWVAGKLPLPEDDPFPNQDAASGISVTREFRKTTLAGGLHEPMQMDIFPDGKILIIERRGALKIVNPQDGSIKESYRLNVFSRHEEGLLGIAIDPDWSVNKWIYLLYTPVNDHSAILLSRFEFYQDRLIPESEKLILRIPTLRNFNHFHAAGCLIFDSEGYLYISTGDNTVHKDGFTVIDERIGQEHLDAQRTSANSMDLKGKILRIKPLPDGSYICPSGNLYTNGDVMIRDGVPVTENVLISRHLKSRMNNMVLENEIGNALTDSGSGAAALTAQHIDSLKKSFGRPEIFAMGFRNPFRISSDNRRKILMVGDVGPDAGKDDSLRGPEGYDELNIIRQAGFYGWPYFIGNNKPYRDFDYNKKIPGLYFNAWNPVNHSRNNSGSRFLPPARPASIWYPFRNSDEFPELFNGTRCIMAGPVYYKDNYPDSSGLPAAYNGRVFIYDFMRNWIMAVNLDSAGNYIHMEQFAASIRLSRPVYLLFDRDGNLLVLEYGTEWYAKNDDAVLSRIEYAGKPDRGNDHEEENHPAVRWDFFDRNKSFYRAGDKIPFRLKFADAGQARLVSINMIITPVKAKNSPESRHKESEMLKGLVPRITEGQLLIDRSDCKSCHAIDRTINGPSYLSIAARYKNQTDAEIILAGKIMEGGTGNWGNRMMIAHPQINNIQAREMTKWILSLTRQRNAWKKEGRYAVPHSTKDVPDQTEVLFHVSDSSGSGETLWLKPFIQQVENADSLTGNFIRNHSAGQKKSQVLVECKDGDVFVLRRIHLKGIRSVEIAFRTSGKYLQTGGSIIEWRLDSANGKVVGHAPIPISGEGNSEMFVRISAGSVPKEMQDAFADLYFIIRNAQSPEQTIAAVDYIRFITAENRK